MCTNLQIKAQDGSVVVGRTMDLNINLKSKLLVFPRGLKLTSRSPQGPGHSWTVKHGFIGMNGLDNQMVADGLNEKGLYCGSLYLPGFTQYQEINAREADKALSPIDVSMYLLSVASNVSEAKTAIQEVIVWSETTPEVGFTFPLHFVVHDRSGACVVFEYVNGELHIHDNPVGVLTNAPTFDWHLTNLNNYTNLSPVDAIGKNLGRLNISQLGEGSGLLGLPGDFTPPSRFVRAVALTQTALASPNATAATQTALHIMNNFDLVTGVERNVHGKKTDCDYTQWTTLADLANGYYFIRMHDTPSYGRIVLSDLNFAADAVTAIDPAQKNWFTGIAAK